MILYLVRELSLDQYLCWWTISPRVYHPPSSHSFGTDMVYYIYLLLKCYTKTALCITVLLHKDCPLYYGIVTQRLPFVLLYCYTKTALCITVLLHKDCPLYYGIVTQGLLFLSRYCYTKITIFTTVLLHKGYHFYKLLTKRYFSSGASNSQI
jgi:hypothetical protein